MPANSSKGTRNERKLVNLLYEDNFGVMRAPASGGATERELPDVFAGDGTNFYAIEAKSSSEGPIYIDRNEIDCLNFFAQKFNGQSKVGVKFDIKNGDPAYGDDDNPGWYFFDPDELYVTSTGNYRVKKEKALQDGESYSEFIEP